MNTQRMKKLQSALPTRQAATVKELAKKLGWSAPTIYRGLTALVDAGAVISSHREGRHVPGPAPKRYVLVKGAAL